MSEEGKLPRKIEELLKSIDEEVKKIESKIKLSKENWINAIYVIIPASII